MQITRDPDVHRWQRLSAAISTVILCFFIVGLVAVGAHSTSGTRGLFVACGAEAAALADPTLASGAPCPSDAIRATPDIARWGMGDPNVPADAEPAPLPPTF